METTIRTATSDDLMRWHGRIPYTMRAVILEVDGTPVVLGGVLHKQNQLIAFMDLRCDPHKYPVSLMKATRRALTDIFSHYQQPIYAIVSDTLESSPRFLKRIGFVPVDEKIMIFKRGD